MLVIETYRGNANGYDQRQINEEGKKLNIGK